MTSGVIKFVNTFVQFLPSLLITRILRFTTQLGGQSNIPRSWQALITHRGLQLCILLFLCLSTKTAIENQYFDLVTNIGAQVRGTISAAIYQKAFRLGASGRQNVTVSIFSHDIPKHDIKPKSNLTQ